MKKAIICLAIAISLLGLVGCSFKTPITNLDNSITSADIIVIDGHSIQLKVTTVQQMLDWYNLKLASSGNPEKYKPHRVSTIYTLENKENPIYEYIRFSAANPNDEPLATTDCYIYDIGLSTEYFYNHMREPLKNYIKFTLFNGINEKSTAKDIIAAFKSEGDPWYHLQTGDNESFKYDKVQVGDLYYEYWINLENDSIYDVHIKRCVAKPQDDETKESNDDESTNEQVENTDQELNTSDNNEKEPSSDANSSDSTKDTADGSVNNKSVSDNIPIESVTPDCIVIDGHLIQSRVTTLQELIDWYGIALTGIGNPDKLDAHEAQSICLHETDSLYSKLLLTLGNSSDEDKNINDCYIKTIGLSTDNFPKHRKEPLKNFITFTMIGGINENSTGTEIGKVLAEYGDIWWNYKSDDGTNEEYNCKNIKFGNYYYKYWFELKDDAIYHFQIEIQKKVEDPQPEN